MATGLGEFFLSIVIDAAKGELTIAGLVKSMGALEVASVGEIAILADLADKLVQVSAAAMESSMHFTNYAASTGASTSALQTWEHVAKHVGVQAETVANGMEAISQGIVGLKKFGENSALANLLLPLHMSLEKYKAAKPEELLTDIRDNPFFQRMDAATKQYVLAKANLGGLLRVLTKGETGVSDKDFARFAHEAGELSRQQIKTFDRMHSDFVSIEELTTRIGRSIATWFSGPTIQFLEKWISILNFWAKALETDVNPKTAGKNLKQFGEQSPSDVGYFLRGLLAFGRENPSPLLQVAGGGPGGLPLEVLATALAAATRKSVVYNDHKVTNISGLGLNEGQVKRVVKQAHQEMISPVAAALDIGASQ
jgi:hypothetical protein